MDEGAERMQGPDVLAEFSRESAGRPLAVYEALINRGMLEDDGAQRAVVTRLDELWADLARSDAEDGLIARLFARPKPTPRGLYIWGPVGRGKTLLMDLFYEAVPAGRPKRRVHFNAFMDDVHARIHAARTAMKEGTLAAGDPIPVVAQALAEQDRLLCFDEFQVTDIADAMILGRLFERMLGAGVVVVATSNVPTQDLYREGLNRALFLPFIALLEGHLDDIRLEARTDYRREKLMGAERYVTPLGPQADAAMDRLWRELTAGASARPRTLALKGRALEVPCASGNVARFSFAELCQRPLGPADYLKIAETFETVLLDRVPVLGSTQRNESKRLILFVDALYDRGGKLALSAAAEPDGLYPEGDLAFEFARTASRLIEMRSSAYLERERTAPAPPVQ